jgi:hypothetical protein
MAIKVIILPNQTTIPHPLSLQPLVTAIQIQQKAGTVL